MNSKEKSRWTALVAVLALIAGAQLIGASPTAALPGLQKEVASSATDSASPKTAIATCDPGSRVVGGGGWVFAIAAADEAKVMLSQLEPVRSGNLDSYVVSGWEVDPGMAGNWWVEAYALCASASAAAGYEIVSGSTSPSSAFVQQTAAVCPGAKEVIGTGARINNPGGQVSLQLARSSGPRDISRVTAKEDASGYAASWNVTAYAICTNPLAGFTAVGQISTQTGSQDTKVVDVECPSDPFDTFVHNAAGATSGIPPGLGTAPPGVAIQVMFPFNDLKRVRVFAVETTPTNASWTLVAQAVCGP